MLSWPVNPDTLRLVVFLTVFLLLAVAEQVWPRRALTISKPRRWAVNLTIVVTNTLLVRLFFPLAPFALALYAQAHGWGLLSLLTLPAWLETLVSLLVLDLLIYTQHRFFHRTPVLWRLHRMHHTDLDLDVSSGTRFHPLEIFLSLVIKLIAVVLLGASPLSILLFEIILNATSMFSHANLRIPLAIDQRLRLLLVTPDMHRVHHSILPLETDSNFGFNLSCWDRLFGTYRAQPGEGHDRMQIGLKQWRDQEALGFWPLLLIPFVRTFKRKTP
ncbi:MAG: sterol desaturase family protein [Desulfobulbaceae bacterium]|nr:sterol desaturase family protein [Desulfobulbaceae bacterium]